MMSQVYQCCRLFIRGLYSCHWRGSSDQTRKYTWLWLLFVTVMSLLTLCWMYVWLVMSNDQHNVNDELVQKLKLQVNWFMVVVIISAVLASYCILLLLFALIQVALGEQLHLHWLHKIVFFFGVIFITCMVLGISVRWKEEWSAVPFSFQATAPFLQFGAVGALTLLSPFVFQRFHLAKARSKMLIAVVFLVVSAAIFLCPLLIQSPCLINPEEQPEKPKLMGHRGAPMLAPENTMMSFHRSLECDVIAFETDVQLSKERLPFLMHDHGHDFLLRTTNAKEKFPNKNFENSSDLTLAELQSLNAGEWFLKTDPFGTVSLLSEEEKETARNQTVPSLLELLNFAQQNNTPVQFDFKSANQENDMKDTVKTILESGIDQSLILWLPSAGREYVKKIAPGFIQVYESETDMKSNNGSHLNVRYSTLTMGEIRKLRNQNVTVNMWVVNESWLFSLLWCAGASSVTTNSCHLLKKMERPDWIMAPSTYNIIWILVDISSALMMIAFFSWKKRCLCHNQAATSTPACNEMNRFLP